MGRPLGTLQKVESVNESSGGFASKKKQTPASSKWPFGNPNGGHKNHPWKGHLNLKSPSLGHWEEPGIHSFAMVLFGPLSFSRTRISKTGFSPPHGRYIDRSKWFEIFLDFIPRSLGRWSYFSNGLKPPTSFSLGLFGVDTPTPTNSQHPGLLYIFSGGSL